MLAAHLRVTDIGRTEVIIIARDGLGGQALSHDTAVSKRAAIPIITGLGVG